MDKNLSKKLDELLKNKQTLQKGHFFVTKEVADTIKKGLAKHGTHDQSSHGRARAGKSKGYVKPKWYPTRGSTKDLPNITSGSLEEERAESEGDYQLPRDTGTPSVKESYNRAMDQASERHRRGIDSTQHMADIEEGIKQSHDKGDLNDEQWASLRGRFEGMRANQQRRRKTNKIVKHGSHDQSTHGRKGSGREEQDPRPAIFQIKTPNGIYNTHKTPHDKIVVSFTPRGGYPEVMTGQWSSPFDAKSAILRHEAALRALSGKKKVTKRGMSKLTIRQAKELHGRIRARFRGGRVKPTAIPSVRLGRTTVSGGVVKHGSHDQSTHGAARRGTKRHGDYNIKEVPAKGGGMRYISTFTPAGSKEPQVLGIHNKWTDADNRIGEHGGAMQAERRGRRRQGLTTKRGSTKPKGNKIRKQPMAMTPSMLRRPGMAASGSRIPGITSPKPKPKAGGFGQKIRNIGRRLQGRPVNVEPKRKPGTPEERANVARGLRQIRGQQVTAEHGRAMTRELKGREYQREARQSGFGRGQQRPTQSTLQNAAGMRDNLIKHPGHADQSVHGRRKLYTRAAAAGAAGAVAGRGVARAGGALATGARGLAVTAAASRALANVVERASRLNPITAKKFKRLKGKAIRAVRRHKAKLGRTLTSAATKGLRFASRVKVPGAVGVGLMAAAVGYGVLQRHTQTAKATKAEGLTRGDHALVLTGNEAVVGVYVGNGTVRVMSRDSYIDTKPPMDDILLIERGDTVPDDNTDPDKIVELVDTLNQERQAMERLASKVEANPPTKKMQKQTPGKKWRSHFREVGVPKTSAGRARVHQAAKKPRRAERLRTIARHQSRMMSPKNPGWKTRTGVAARRLGGTIDAAVSHGMRAVRDAKTRAGAGEIPASRLAVRGLTSPKSRAGTAARQVGGVADAAIRTAGRAIADQASRTLGRITPNRMARDISTGSRYINRPKKVTKHAQHDQSTHGRKKGRGAAQQGLRDVRAGARRVGRRVQREIGQAGSRLHSGATATRQVADDLDALLRGLEAGTRIYDKVKSARDALMGGSKKMTKVEKVIEAIDDVQKSIDEALSKGISHTLETLASATKLVREQKPNEKISGESDRKLGVIIDELGGMVSYLKDVKRKKQFEKNQNNAIHKEGSK